MLLLILLAAAWLRFMWLDLADVRFDEASALQHARGIAEGHLLAVLPFSGSVVNHPPAFAYALAPPYWFSRDVRVAIGWRALLDVAAVALTWVIGRRYFGGRVGLLAALLFAVAPWAVHFARKTWATVLPLGSALMLLGLLELATCRRARGWAAVGAGLALTVGAHWAGVYLLPLVVGVALTRRHTLRPVLLGIGPLLLIVGAYLAYDARHDFPNLRALASALQEREKVESSTNALQLALWISGGAHLSDLTGPAFAAWQRSLPPLLPGLDDVQVFGLCASAAGVALLALRRRAAYSSAALGLVLACFAVPVILQLLLGPPVQLQYVLVTYPASFLLMALGADWLWRRGGVWLRLALGAAIVALLGWQVFTTLHFYDFIQRHDTAPGGYGPPLRRILSAVSLAQEVVRNGQAQEVIVVAVDPVVEPSKDELATVLDVVLADLPHRFADARFGLILREEPVAYSFTPSAALALSLWREHVSSEKLISRTSALRLSGEQTITVALAPPARLPGDVVPHSAQWPGFGLLGYAVRWREEGALLLLYVRVFNPPQEDLHWFAHAYQGDRFVAQHDTSGIHPRSWRAGDVLLLWFDLPLQRDVAYRLRVGAYRYPQVQNLPVLDAVGQPVDDALTIELSPVVNH